MIRNRIILQKIFNMIFKKKFRMMYKKQKMKIK